MNTSSGTTFFVFDQYKWGALINDEIFADLKLLTNNYWSLSYKTMIFQKTHSVVKRLTVVGGHSFNQNELIDLLKKMPNVHDLKLSEVSFDQSFYEQLPSIFRILSYLWIHKPKKSFTNLSFIHRFKELGYFQNIDQNYSQEDAIQLRQFNRNHAPDFGKFFWNFGINC